MSNEVHTHTTDEFSRSQECNNTITKRFFLTLDCPEQLNDIDFEAYMKKLEVTLLSKLTSYEAEHVPTEEFQALNSGNTPAGVTSIMLDCIQKVNDDLQISNSESLQTRISTVMLDCPRQFTHIDFQKCIKILRSEVSKTRQIIAHAAEGIGNFRRQSSVTTVDGGDWHGQPDIQQKSNDLEDDLHEKYLDCSKNPGHRKMVPIVDFQLHHIPEAYRDIDLYRLIKLAAKLTVRVAVEGVSSNRPQFWPDTELPYPFHNKKNIAMKRYGSGHILKVRLIRGVDLCDPSTKGLCHRKACPCEDCLHSECPSNVWCEFYVATATHIVFDDMEAKHTSCRLFFDKPDSPKIILRGASFKHVFDDVKRDFSLLKLVTCKDDVIHKLVDAVRKYNGLRKTLYTKYKTKSENKISFIVSHPHGGPKHVSVGHLVESHLIKESKNIMLTKLIYDNCTCLGSSGARVHCVSLRKHLHCHSSALNSSIKSSGTGICFR